tara:strand:- start:6852 stop:7760 length:909 start_codon:yes stop_codon:yes gene_type:complete
LDKVFAISGPTSSGKTNLAIKLAQNIDGEVIGVDSRQIYKSIPIGTAQPSKKELDAIPHHLIGIKDLNEPISAGEYAKLVDEKIYEIIDRKKVPILCGGTGLYFKALFEGIFSESKTDLDVRKRLEKEYDIDKEVLYKKLESIDPNYALKVHINNKKRLIRALELYETTGKNMSDNFSSENEKSDFHDRFFTVYLKMSRPILQKRIVKRTNYMLENGLIEEVKNIIDKGYDVSQLDYIGFDEIASYLIANMSLQEACEKIIIRTRQYAKRQLKWFDAQEFNIVIDADNINSDDMVDKITQIC